MRERAPISMMGVCVRERETELGEILPDSSKLQVQVFFSGNTQKTMDRERERESQPSVNVIKVLFAGNL